MTSSLTMPRATVTAAAGAARSTSSSVWSPEKDCFPQLASESADRKTPSCHKAAVFGAFSRNRQRILRPIASRRPGPGPLGSPPMLSMRSLTPARAATLVLLGALLPLLVALASQYWGGLSPCELCLDQR